MDNLSSLKSGLPRESAIRELADLDNSLIKEFKTAANAVTKLFKLSGAKTMVGRTQGYIDAIEDLLDALEKDPNMNVLEWALQKQRLFHENDGSLSGANNTQSGSGGQSGDNNPNPPSNQEPPQRPSSSLLPPQVTHSSPSPPPIPQNAFTFESSVIYPQETLTEPHGPFELGLEDPIQVEDSQKRRSNYVHRHEKRLKRE